jgi:hypothetical protein
LRFQKVFKLENVSDFRKFKFENVHILKNNSYFLKIKESTEKNKKANQTGKQKKKLEENQTGKVPNGPKT